MEKPAPSSVLLKPWPRRSPLYRRCSDGIRCQKDYLFFYLLFLSSLSRENGLSLFLFNFFFYAFVISHQEASECRSGTYTGGKSDPVNTGRWYFSSSPTALSSRLLLCPFQRHMMAYYVQGCFTHEKEARGETGLLHSYGNQKFYLFLIILIVLRLLCHCSPCPRDLGQAFRTPT